MKTYILVETMYSLLRLYYTINMTSGAMTMSLALKVEKMKKNTVKK